MQPASTGVVVRDGSGCSATVLLIGLIVGWIFGNVWVRLGCALALHLGWQLANLASHQIDGFTPSQLR